MVNIHESSSTFYLITKFNSKNWLSNEYVESKEVLGSKIKSSLTEWKEHMNFRCSLSSSH